MVEQTNGLEHACPLLADRKTVCLPDAHYLTEIIPDVVEGEERRPKRSVQGGECWGEEGKVEILGRDRPEGGLGKEQGSGLDRLCAHQPTAFQRDGVDGKHEVSLATVAYGRLTYLQILIPSALPAHTHTLFPHAFRPDPSSAQVLPRSRLSPARLVLCPAHPPALPRQFRAIGYPFLPPCPYSWGDRHLGRLLAPQ